MARPDYERVEVRNRAEWRAWLEANHRQDESIWLVTWKKGKGPYLPYGEIVEEALCFGWIDSRPAKLDDKRTMLLLSPRRPGSAWSAVNKARVARLIEQGRMAPAGLAKIEQAKRDGTWEALDEVESLASPDDLLRALKAHAPAADNFAEFSRSSRRGILEWIAAAKRPATRAKRIDETARLAAEGLKANHPRDRKAPEKDAEP